MARPPLHPQRRARASDGINFEPSVEGRPLPSSSDLTRVLVSLLLLIGVTACKTTVGAPDPGSTHFAAPPGALFVALNGSDSNAGTEASPWLTLQHAVSAAADGSTIVVRAGEYHQGNVVNNWTSHLNNTPVDSKMLDPAYPMAGSPDMVFYNGLPLRQVASQSLVHSGT